MGVLVNSQTEFTKTLFIICHKRAKSKKKITLLNKYTMVYHSDLWDFKIS